MQPRIVLTDKFIDSLKAAAAPGKRDFYPDALVPSFGVRVTDKTAKSFTVYRRWPGLIKTPAHRTVGTVGKIGLGAARDLARKWIELAEKGIDPREEKRKAELQEQARHEHLFGTVAEDWLTSNEVNGQRKREEVRSDVRREFIAIWKSRPVTSITTPEIANVIRVKAKRTPAQARNLLGYIKRLYLWALDQHAYGLEASPAAALSAKRLCGKKKKRKRWLNDEELRRVWQAAGGMGYPYGPLFRMLALTGQRESEVGEARWREFDMKNKLWIIPHARMKMDNDHAVPLSDDVVALLQSLPRFNGGDYLFSTDNGKKPVNGYGKAKERIDALIGEIPHWVIHDIRRTVRTNFSALKIAHNVRERMIAHAPSEIEQTYDPNVLAYLDEKREGFELWAARLRGIVKAQ